MAEDLILNEGELSIAANKIDKYFEFLEGCLSEYSAIVDSIPVDGLKDSKITLMLISLSQAVALEKYIFFSQCDDVGKAVKKEISGIEKADHFVYPNISFQDIVSILTSFL